MRCVSRTARAVLVLCAGIALCEPPIVSAEAPVRLSLDDLGASYYAGGLISNAAFVPDRTALAAREPFFGSLRLTEARMQTSPARLKSDRVLGKQTTLFPAVEISFFTVGGDLVPASQNVLRCGSLDHGRSFWDLIIQPGRVWSEPRDGLWSRAAFPFALVNSLEGETHNGVAMFAYRGGRVSNLRFQIAQQTSPYYVSDYFTASGIVPASWRKLPIPELETLTQEYEKSLAEAVPVRSWAELADRVGAERLAGFDETLSAGDRVVAGLDYQGTFYLKYCTSAAGDLPWCDRARFGVWSATKALVNTTALLRLAQKFGPQVFDERIADYVEEAKAYPAWREVRFVDAINMATGVGNGSVQWNPNNVSDGYIDPTYDAWYSARTESAKVHALLEAARAYPWGPGRVARYRDQDMFLLGVAMDRYLKAKEGGETSLWTMLERQVFAPIGIRYAPTNRTAEAKDEPGQPLMAFGYYPTIGDMVRIARLYQNDGRHHDAQILYAPRVHERLHARGPLGFSTGEKRRFGETFYYHAFWMNAFQAGERCQILYPVMEGWGGNLIALFPQGLTAIRLAKARSDDDRSGDPTDMAVAADRLEAFCP
jgi:hypothetical protein